VGEIAPSHASPFKPAMTPPPKAPAKGSRAAGPAGPPWAPAPVPARTIGPLPAPPTRSSLPQFGPGLRVPGDMAERPAVAEPDGPTTIPDFEKLPGFETPAGPDRPAAAAAQATQESLDFAAAPIPGDYTASAPPAPGFSSLWDLATTDVFPAASADGDPGEPGVGNS
jgi:hypothetical protein